MVSSIFHEIILILTFRLVCLFLLRNIMSFWKFNLAQVMPYLFLSQMLQIPLIMIGKKLKGTIQGIVLLLVTFFSFSRKFLLLGWNYCWDSITVYIVLSRILQSKRWFCCLHKQPASCCLRTDTPSMLCEYVKLYLRK